MLGRRVDRQLPFGSWTRKNTIPPPPVLVPSHVRVQDPAGRRSALLTSQATISLLAMSYTGAEMRSAH